MDSINRKLMRDVLVKHSDVIKRHPPVVAPEHKSPSHDIKDSERIEKNPFFKTTPKHRVHTPSSRKPSRGLLWVLVLLALLTAGFITANYFSSATIYVTPSSQQANVDHSFKAIKDGTEGSLAFQFMSLTETKVKEVPATLEKKIQRKASGKVIIYNNYSGDSQRLIKNTRFESQDRKIFRINDSIIVPGAKISGGKIIEPGAIEVVIYADIEGKDYNIGLSDFILPGFKGDPRYSKFTAKSKPDSPISGGYSDTIKVPTEQAVKEAQTALKEELKGIAIEKARAQIPEDVTFFPGSIILKFEEVPQDLSSDNTTSVSIRAVVSVFFFDTALLVKKIAEAATTDYRREQVTLQDMSALKFTFLDDVSGVVLEDIKHIRFNITGIASFIGQVDSEKIRVSLVGKPRSDFEKIIISHDNIGKNSVAVRPMWRTTFPLDPQKITVKILSTEEAD